MLDRDNSIACIEDTPPCNSKKKETPYLGLKFVENLLSDFLLQFIVKRDSTNSRFPSKPRI